MASTFEGVVYHLAETLSPSRRSELAYVLDSEGATTGLPDEATHIITKSAEFQGSQEIREEVAVVSDLWVERSMILGKAQPPQFYSVDSAKFFSGIVACSADLPACDIEVVSGTITALGGQWRLAYTRDVTHLFALTPTTDRYLTALHHQATTRVIILTPHWFDDAVLFGRCIPTAEYEWPDPAVLRSALHAPDRTRVEEMKDTAKRTRAAGEKRAMFRTALMSPGRGVEVKSAWGGRRILLSTSLELTGRRRSAVEAGIERAGGVVVRYESKDGDGDLEEEALLVEDADALVTRYRAGWAYIKAYRSKKMIGTLAWLFNVESTGTLSAPTDQLLHYPLSSTPIEGFCFHEITVTNYTGEAREYLKRLIIAMGATFTPSMSSRNTVVIAAFIGGTKTDKAVHWSIPIVNHTWLEDCFAAWRNLTPATYKYIHFPPNVNFADMLGERGVGRVVLDDEDLAALEADAAGGLGVGEGERMDVDAGVGGIEEYGEHPVPTGASAREVEDEIALADDVKPSSRVNGKVISKPASPKKPQSPKKPSSAAKPVPLKKGMRARVEDAVAETSIAVEQEMEVEAPDHDTIDVPRARRGRPLVRRSGTRREMEFESAVEVESFLSNGDDTRDDDEEPRKSRRAKAGSDREDSAPPTRPSRSPAKASSSRHPASPPVMMSPARRPGRTLSSRPPASPSRRPATPTISEGEEPRPPVSGRKSRREPAPSASKEDTADEEGENEVDAFLSTIITKPRSMRPPVAPAPASPSLKRAGPSGTRRVVSAVIANPKASPSRDRAAKITRTESIRVTAEEAPIPSAKRGRPSSKWRAGSDTTESWRPSAVPDETGASEPEPPQRPTAGPSGHGAGQRSPSRRSAAAKATQLLKDVVMPDMNNFAKERRTGRVRGAWETDSVGKVEEEDAHGVPNVREKENALVRGGRAGSRGGKKRASEEADEESVDEVDERQAKKRKGSTQVVKGKKAPSTDESSSEDEVKEAIPFPGMTKLKPSRTVRLLVTQTTISDDVMKGLERLGVKPASGPADCTHVVMKSLKRSEKLLCAIPVAKFILSDKWAKESAKARRLLPEEKFLLHDPDNEQRHNCTLAEALQRAAQYPNGVFAGHTFYVTPKLRQDDNLLKNVINANGGTYSTKTPTIRMLQDKDDRHLVSHGDDEKIWRPLADLDIPIYSKEIVLHSAMVQELDADEINNRLRESLT